MLDRAGQMRIRTHALAPRRRKMSGSAGLSKWSVAGSVRRSKSSAVKRRASLAQRRGARSGTDVCEGPEREVEGGDDAGAPGDEALAVVAVGECAGGQGKGEERQDVDKADQAKGRGRVGPLVDLPDGDGRDGLAAEQGEKTPGQVVAEIRNAEGGIRVMRRCIGRSGHRHAEGLRKAPDWRVASRLSGDDFGDAVQEGFLGEGFAHDGHFTLTAQAGEDVLLAVAAHD